MKVNREQSRILEALSLELSGAALRVRVFGQYVLASTRSGERWRIWRDGIVNHYQPGVLR